MPEVKASKTFHSTQFGYIRAGTRFSADRQYAMQLRANGLIVILNDDGTEPARVQALAGAPAVKAPHPDGIQVIDAKKLPPEPPPASDDTGDPPGAGAAKPSALSRAAQALRRQTAPTSKASAKR